MAHKTPTRIIKVTEIDFAALTPAEITQMCAVIEANCDLATEIRRAPNGDLELLDGQGDLLSVVDISQDMITDGDGDTRVELVESGAPGGLTDQIDFVVDGVVQMSLAAGKLTLNGLFIDPATGFELTPQAANPAPAGSDPDATLWIDANKKVFRGSRDLEDNVSGQAGNAISRDPDGRAYVSVSDFDTTTIESAGPVDYELLTFPPAQPVNAPADASTGDTHIERYQNGLAYFEHNGTEWTIKLFEGSDDRRFTVRSEEPALYVNGSLAGPQNPPANPSQSDVHLEVYANALVYFNYQSQGPAAGWDGNNITYVPRGVQTVTGTAVDNTDPLNPVIDAPDYANLTPAQITSLMTALGLPDADNDPTGIDFAPTGNPDEFTVSFTYTDVNGVSQTLNDSTPVTIVSDIDTSGSVDAATAALTTTNGVAVAIGEPYLLFPDGTTWASGSGAAQTLFIETRCYEESGAAIDVDGLLPYLDEINPAQLATLPAGTHMRWTAPSAAVLTTLEVARLGPATSTTISWVSSNGDAGSDTVTGSGANLALNLGSIALAAGDTIDFTLDGLTGGQMQLAVEATSIANGWTALQDYSAFATTSHWSARLIGSEPVIEHIVNVYEDSTGATFYAEVIGEDLTSLASIDPTWTLCPVTPIVSVDPDNVIAEGADGGALYVPEKIDVCGINEFINNIKPFYMILSKEGPSSGANVTTNVNGVPSVYESLVNSVDNGNGELSWNAGSNSNFNSHATTPTIVECDEYIELIKGGTANFHTEAVSISSDNLINAQVDQGDLRILLAPGGYTVFDTSGVQVASGANEAGTYRFTRTLYGFRVDKDGVEIYTTPEVCIDRTPVTTYDAAERFYANTSFHRTTVPRSYDFILNGNTPAAWASLTDNGGTLTDNNGTLTNVETSTGWVVGSTSNEEAESVCITMEAQNLATGSSNGLFMFGLSRAQAVPAAPTFAFDYAINVRETLVRAYESGANIAAAQQNGITAVPGDKFEVRVVGNTVEYVHTPVGGTENIFWVSNQPVVLAEENIIDLHARVEVLEDAGGVGASVETTGAPVIATLNQTSGTAWLVNTSTSPANLSFNWNTDFASYVEHNGLRYYSLRMYFDNDGEIEFEVTGAQDVVSVASHGSSLGAGDFASRMVFVRRNGLNSISINRDNDNDADMFVDVTFTAIM